MDLALLLAWGLLGENLLPQIAEALVTLVYRFCLLLVGVNLQDGAHLAVIAVLLLHLVRDVLVVDFKFTGIKIFVRVIII